MAKGLEALKYHSFTASRDQKGDLTMIEKEELTYGFRRSMGWAEGVKWLNEGETREKEGFQTTWRRYLI